MEKQDIYIVGAGTYGEVMFELVEELGYSVKGFYDENTLKKGLKLCSVEILGGFFSLLDSEITNRNFVVAIGNNSVRFEIMKKINELGGNTPTLIHPKATISSTAKLGTGVYIHMNACLWTKVEIGDFSIISPNAVIAHHSIIGKACLISTLSGVGASIIIEDKVFIGMGSTIVTGVQLLGEKSIIGAGAVVLSNVEADNTYVGVPAKKLFKKDTV